MIYLGIIRKYKFFIIIIFDFLLFIIIIEHQIYSPSIRKENNILNSLAKINETQNIERHQILERGIKYLNKCLNIENNSCYKKNKNPIITVIIPSYNCEKTIIPSIRSIQYQNFSNIEIILVDDFSTDKSKEIIYNIQVKDKRVKLIENKKNMGTLYSRCLGSLFSRGNYILCLDNDDFFFDEDLFDYIYKESIKDDLDIIAFRALSSCSNFENIDKIRDFHYFGFPNNLYLSQPNLGVWTLIIKGKFRMHNHMIWSKSIKLNIYQKAVNLLGIQRYSKYICWAEDTSINFIIFNIASSFKYIHKFGYFHIIKKTSATFTQNKNNKLYGDLFFLDIMFDFTKNSSDKNYVVSQALHLKHMYKINQYSNNTNNKYLTTILYKIINCEFINVENKILIKKAYKSFLSYIL